MFRSSAILIGLCLCAQFTYGQSRLQGTVVDAVTGNPLTGVSIMDLQDTSGTVTGSNGGFSMQISRRSDTLRFVYTGYETRKFPGDHLPAIVRLRSSSTALNELVVSASREWQKRTEVPVAISVISDAMLRQVKPVTLDQVLNKVSGVYMVDLGNEQHTMAIRQPIGYRSNFLYLEDGIPIRTVGDFNHNALIEINQADIQRIEVVKGPSSSLYGSDAVGGAVNFISKEPEEDPSLDFRLEGSNLGYRRADLTTSNTWGNTGLLLSGYYAQQQHGYIDHSDFHKATLTARVTHPLGSRAMLTAQLTWLHYNTDQNGGLDSAHFFARDYHTFYTFTYRKVNAWRGNIRIDKTWSTNSRSTITGYYRNNLIGQNPFYAIKNTEDPLKASGEINEDFFHSFGLLARHSFHWDKWDMRLSGGLQIEYSPAGYLARYIAIDKDNAGYFRHYTATDSLLTDYGVNLLNTAAYAQWQASPVKSLRVTAGIRLDRLDYAFDNHLTPSAFTGAPDEKNHFAQFTPKIGATYDLKKDRGVYANLSIGFAPPDISDLYRGVRVPYLKPARYTSYEAGGWMDFAHQKGRADVSLYRMQGIDEIISVRLADGSSINRNAGKTLHYGIEYTVSYQPVPQWTVRLSGTNARHQFITYVENGKDYNGREMNGAPHWIMHTTLTYRPAFISGLSAALEWQHLSSYYMDPENTSRYRGYDLFNARLDYQWKKWEVWVHLVNCGNTLYATTAEKNAYGVTYRPGPIRTLYLGIGYRLSGENQSRKIPTR